MSKPKNDSTSRDITERRNTEEALRKAKDRPEVRVKERTAQLEQANCALQEEIAERRRAEGTVAAERQRFFDVLETLPAYLILLTPDYHVPFANRFFRERFGEAEGRRCFEYLFGRSEPCEICETYNTLKTMSPHGWEWTGPDGRNYDIYDFPFTDADGSTLILEMGMDITERKQAESELKKHRDHLEELVLERTNELESTNAQLQSEVTERKNAEEALRQTNEELSALINCSPLPINTLDCNGNVTLWNPAAEAVFGWTEAEVLGRFLPIVPAEAKDEFLGYLSMVFAGETLKGKEVRRIRKDGSIADLRVWAAPLRDRDGKAIGCVSVLDDMTERKQLKAQLWQSQRMEAVGRLAGGIAHEFRNLLMGISSYAEMLQMKLGPDHAEFETANELLQCVDRAARLAGQLQTFGRRQSLEIRPTDLNVLVSESEHFLEHLLGEHIEMTLDLSGEPAIADVDPSQIEQVLTNLAINARDAMPQGGQLAIRTRVTRIDDPTIRQSHDLDQDRYVEISVTDTGSGMDEATVHQIFEPFFTTKGSDGRMGLGLSVTYGIVKQHKGFIEVKSELGEGSTFLVHLPAAEHASACDEQATFQPKRGKETILLAEDEDIVRMPVKSLLEAYGYTVLVAGDGEEAIKLFERHVGEIDLAVLDLVMPKAGGRLVWQVIRETKPDTKVLFISGHTAAAHEYFMPPSDLPLLSKPFSVLNLVTKIREILD